MTEDGIPMERLAEILSAPRRRRQDELPEDPDAELLPDGYMERDGERVTITGRNPLTGEIEHLPGHWMPVPGLVGELHRRES